MLDLDLDAAVASGEFGLDLLEQLFGRVLNADRDAASDLAACSAQKFPQRLLPFLRLRVPQRVLQTGLGHAVAPDFTQQRCGFPALCQRAPDQSGREMMRDRRPRALDPLAAVKGVFGGYALGPTVDALAMGSDQQNAPAVDAAEARLEKMDERHLNFA